MNSYTFEVVVGTDENGQDIRETVVIEADNFAQARHQLTEITQQRQQSAG